MGKEQQAIFVTTVTSSAVQFRLAVKKWGRWWSCCCSQDCFCIWHKTG